jgi:hypothetical protein
MIFYLSANEYLAEDGWTEIALRLEPRGRGPVRAVMRLAGA